MPYISDSDTGSLQAPLKPESNLFAGVILENVAFQNRVADLEGSRINGNFIGWELNGGGNQRWTFHGPDHFQTLSVVQSDGSPGVSRPIYASTHTDQLIYGTNIEDWASHYNLEVVGVRGQLVLWRISCADRCSGRTVCWTLASDRPGEKITIEPWTGSSNQMWFRLPG